ncbi:MAG TPA: DMT family transporter [Casimicrobiaceae bacterium]|nr:DMT family transporter [Casimicrobiaceae bacterium]
MRPSILDRTSPATLLALTSLFWAGNMVIGRAVADAMSPIALAYWRWIIVIGVLAPFCWREVVARRAVLLRSWRILLLLSVMSTGLYSALTYWSLHYTTATNTTLLNSTIPIWVTVASWILLKHLPPARALLGFLISLAGVLFIVAHGHPGTLFTLAPNVGDLIILLALFLWGFYAVLLRYRPAELSPLGYVFVTAVIGTVIATPVFLLDHALSATPDLSWQALAAIGYFALFSSLAATLCYNNAVDRVGPVHASLFIHLVPLFGSLLAIAFLAERPGWQHLIGMALVLSGIVQARRAAVVAPRC